MKYQISKDSVMQMQSDEGCVLHAYKDTGGVWTIGFGHTKDVKQGDIISSDQAIVFLMQDMQIASDQVNSLNLDINQNQFDALVNLVYNCGIGHFKSSPLYQFILFNPNNPVIRESFLNTCVHDGHGQVLQGLILRREKEADLYFS